MRKLIRVYLGRLSVDYDVWNFEVMKDAAETLLKSLFPNGGAAISKINFMRCSVVYEVPADFQTNLINEYSFRASAEDIKD